MKLILVYNWDIPWEASGTDTLPFEYSSKEQAFVDFFQAKEDTKNQEKFDFYFLDRRWNAYEDLESAVKFFELDEWFDNYKLDNSANKD